MQRITPFLWFDGKAEEAAQFYTSIFKNSKDWKHLALWRGGTRAKRSGDVRDLSARWTGVHRVKRRPGFTFSPAISFFVNCETQEELDEIWEKLCENGKKKRCGWLEDKFGVSWQDPHRIRQADERSHPQKSGRVMKAIFKWRKSTSAPCRRRTKTRVPPRKRGVDAVNGARFARACRFWRLSFDLITEQANGAKGGRSKPKTKENSRCE